MTPGRAVALLALALSGGAAPVVAQQGALFDARVQAVSVAGRVDVKVDREKLRAFLKVTGFDVALDSIALSAKNAPAMLGRKAEDFGFQWREAADEVFASDKMQGMALDILEQALSADLLDHATTFYVTPLGLKLVTLENEAHMTESTPEGEAAEEALISQLRADNPERLAVLERLNSAVDASESSVRAVQEIQLRFLLAADAAGVMRLKLGEEGLRELLRGGEAALAESLEKSALQSAAWTYRSLTDEELLTYAEALEDPKMQRVYELMNAIQWEVMANRFEALAVRMGTLEPVTDL
ncbi:DUF2059 domain-containing protein [Rhodobacteraceae bacterium 10Alg 79]|uniref:DUF2059 domain-containing protein n=1 Tax=Rhodalgimonas zhirmunskyi TaxID=2964767 RepID=A0AAJ1X4E6_9RHOB|nr:DUF2059 domain-containing protein [Rhodoalgimonas zhirmunskyi]